MSSDRPADYLLSLVHELCALPRETEWVEFKVSEAEPDAAPKLMRYLPFWAAAPAESRR